MSSQAYDQKNEDDYDANTQKLNEALDKISNDPKLPATQKQVAKLAGVNRNTVRNRGFPKVKLKKIVEDRKKQAEEEKEETKSEVVLLKEERDQLSREVVLWFSEFNRANRDRSDFEHQLKRQISNSEFYKKEFEKQKDRIKELEFHNEQLKELLREVNK